MRYGKNAFFRYCVIQKTILITRANAMQQTYLETSISMLPIFRLEIIQFFNNEITSYKFKGALHLLR